MYSRFSSSVLIQNQERACHFLKIWIKEHNENEKETEIVVDEQLENNEEDLVTTFLQNRRRGFKRKSPSSPAEQKSKDSTHYVPNKKYHK